MSRNSDSRAIDYFVIQGLLEFLFRLVMLLFLELEGRLELVVDPFRPLLFLAAFSDLITPFASIIIRIIYQKTGASANPDPLKGFR